MLLQTCAESRNLSIAYLEDCDAASDDDVVGDVLHDAGGLSGDEGEEDGRLVEVPEEEELAPRGRRRAHVAEEVGALVPEDPVEAQHHLVQVAVAKALDGLDLQRDIF